MGQGKRHVWVNEEYKREVLFIECNITRDENNTFLGKSLVKETLWVNPLYTYELKFILVISPHHMISWASKDFDGFVYKFTKGYIITIT